jgi:hypothetical protein
MRNSYLFLALVFLILVACNNNQSKQVVDDAAVLHQNEINLTDLIVYDIFSPPVASRIYVYTSLAAHEAMRHQNPKESSLIAKLKGFGEMPQPDKNKQYNYGLSASKAFYTVAAQMTFSKDTLAKFESETYAPFQEMLSKEVFDNSLAFGESVGKAILQRAAADNYKQTRSMEKYFGSKDDGKWQPTSPDYLDATEPYWQTLKSIIADSSNQFDPGPPPVFNKKEGSEFYEMNKEVYTVGKNLTEEQKTIASFWDDNPFVMGHVGHMMAATKKQTPGGHWIGIATIACRLSKADAVKSARTYALTALALFEGFISVFDTKFRYNYVRPITFINQAIDNKWEPFLQTPPFPEYTSGHSTITGSAATVLTNLYGDKFAFTDSSNKRYINMERSFTSFIQAAEECSVSRLYGGIHYRISVDKGLEAGKKIGNFIISKLQNNE